MGKSKKSLATAVLGILLVMVSASIAVATIDAYTTYIPIIYKYVPPTPSFTLPPSITPTLTKTPTSTMTATPTKTRTPTITPTPSSSGNMVITTIFYDGVLPNEPDEYVEIRNADTISIQLQNWTLRDEAWHIFTFPSFVIQPGQVCRVYTNQDHPEWCGFNYHSGAPIWNNTGQECGYLSDANNILIDQYCY